MKARKIYIALLPLLFFSFQTELIAQQVAASVMNVTVEVVSGSSVEMDSNEWITLNNETTEPALYATVIIRHQEDSVILTSSLDSITLVNGTDQFEMNSSMTEYMNGSGDIELHFTGTKADSVNSGKYSGKQIAEIIYL